MQQIGEIMAALGPLRGAVDRLFEASLAYMKLGWKDMGALHFLIVAANLKKIATRGCRQPT